MIDVDNAHRPFLMGSRDSRLLASLPIAAPTPGKARPNIDQGRAPLMWNKTSMEPKSDGELDDDDNEYRPFTPPPPRERLSYTRYQLELLNGIYNQVRYPNSTQKQLIAKRVGITREQVKIWFQNRRRKDVVGASNTEKCETPSPQGDKSHQKPSVERTESCDGFSEESSSSKDSESADSLVPSVVLKSVITELERFQNDPLKGKKKRKKAKTVKAKEKEKTIRKGLTNTLMQGGYDMISPPNQITPNAFFDKVKTGFNHSKISSAFESPRDMLRTGSNEHVLHNSSKTSPPQVHTGLNDLRHGNPRNPPTLHGPAGYFLPTSLSSNVSHSAPNGALDIPVLSELLSYKSSLEARHKEVMSAVHGRVMSSAHHQNSDNNRSRLQNSVSNPSRSMNGIFPFPFIADQPVMLSSLRQPDQIYRPYPQYPPTIEDPYQPLLISSLTNPYYSSSNLSTWTNHNITSPPSYTSL